MARKPPQKHLLFPLLALDGALLTLVLGYALTQGLTQRDLYWVVPIMAVVAALQFTILRRFGGRSPGDQ